VKGRKNSPCRGSAFFCGLNFSCSPERRDARRLPTSGPGAQPVSCLAFWIASPFLHPRSLMPSLDWTKAIPSTDRLLASVYCPQSFHVHSNSSSNPLLMGFSSSFFKEGSRFTFFDPFCRLCLISSLGFFYFFSFFFFCFFTKLLPPLSRKRHMTGTISSSPTARSPSPTRSFLVWQP